MARPTLLTPKVRRTICAALHAGHPFEIACELAGIAPSTGYEWRARGAGRDPRRRSSTPYREFALAVARAEAPPKSTTGHQDAGLFAEMEHEGARSDFPARANPGYDGLNAEPSEQRDNRQDAWRDAGETEPTEEFAERPLPDTPQKNARAREASETQRNPSESEEPSPRAWLSQRSRGERSILDEVF
jgi:hypothetical protein